MLKSVHSSLRSITRTILEFLVSNLWWRFSITCFLF